MLKGRNRKYREVSYDAVIDWMNHRKPTRFRVNIEGVTERACYIKLWRGYTRESVASENFKAFMSHVKLAGHHPRRMSSERSPNRFYLFLPALD